MLALHTTEYVETRLIAACQHIFDCELPEHETCVNHYTVTAELTVAFGEDRNNRN